MTSLPQQQQQPVQVYPNTGPKQPSSSSSHSNGSFGTVFIVLAVILVISAIACFLGRLCNRRHDHHHHRPKARQSHPPPPLSREREANQNHDFHARDGGDIELGFRKGIPGSKHFGNGEAKGDRPVIGNGEIRDEQRLADEGLRAGDHHNTV